MKRFKQSAGSTMVEMIVTFALLSLFMVAATRVISYTTGIYHSAKGSATGLEVSTIISNKVVGMIEGAINEPEVTRRAGQISDSIKFTDATESNVVIDAQNMTVSSHTGDYLNIHYDPASHGSIQYEETDFRYDPKTYMGYEVKELRFQNPGEEYPENVVKMTITLHSVKYGDYTSNYYIKAVNAAKIKYGSE